MSPRKPIRAVLYARFSPRNLRTKDAERASEYAKKNSCDVQIADMKRYCEHHGIEVIAIRRDDAKSGKSAERRPEFQDALALCRRGDMLLLRDFSRFSRNTIQTLDFAFRLARRGVVLASLEDGVFDPNDPNSFLMFGIRAVLAQVERMKTSSRTREKVNRYQNVDGRRMSKIPAYGRAVSPTDPKMTIPQPQEQAVIERIKALRAEGLSYRAIAQRLDQDGVSCRGKPWTHTTIESILRRADFRHSA